MSGPNKVGRLSHVSDKESQINATLQFVPTISFLVAALKTGPIVRTFCVQKTGDAEFLLRDVESVVEVAMGVAFAELFVLYEVGSEIRHRNINRSFPAGPEGTKYRYENRLV